MRLDGYVKYPGDQLGLTFDVYASQGQPVYGPLVPPPGQPVMQALPYGAAPGTVTTESTPTLPAYLPPAPPTNSGTTTPEYNPAAAATCPTGSTTRSTPAAGDTVLSQLPSGAYCVQPAPAAAAATTPDPQPGDPNAGAQVVGSATGAAFSFTQAASDLLTQAEAIAPWYVWAGGAAALLFFFTQHQKTTRRKRT